MVFSGVFQIHGKHPLAMVLLLGYYLRVSCEFPIVAEINGLSAAPFTIPNTNARLSL